MSETSFSETSCKLVDTHCHLDEHAFEVDCDEVVQRARECGVEAIVTVGTTADSSRRAVELAERYPEVFAAVGVQPNYTAEATPDDWDEIVRLLEHPKVVAVGETGLDRYWDFASFDLQVEWFRRHLELARERSLPVIVHCRDAERDVLEVLQQAHAAGGRLSGVMHSFSADWSVAEACVNLGLCISFSGMLTFKKNESLRQVAARLPAERILVETDAPYLAPSPNRGKRNEPAFLRFTAAKLAEVRGWSVEQAGQVTSQNARRLFQLPPHD